MSQQSSTAPARRPGPPTPAPGRPGGPAGMPPPAPPGQLTTTAPVLPARGGGLRAVVRSAFEGTPGRMRVIAAVVALAAAVFGVVGANSLWTSSAALERADHNTTQVVRVQSIYSDLVRADAATTNAFLVGGLDTTGQGPAYDEAVAHVAATVAAAAEAQPADGAALGALNQQIQTYTSLVEQARAYNRQGLPVGATYLTNASTGLRSGALPIVTLLTQANTDRANAEFRQSSNGLALGISGVVALLVLLGGLLWLARRSHRYLNVPVLIAVGLVLVALVAGAFTLGQVGSTVTTVRGTVFDATLDLATIQSSAYDAKANESLTLISRGSGQAFERAWQGQSTLVKTTIGYIDTAGDATLSTDLGAKWTAYSAKHQEIRSQDDGTKTVASNWDEAVRLAGLPTSTAGSANATFDAFSQATADGLATYSQQTSDQVLAPRTAVTIVGWALLLLCLAAAGLAARGFGQRLEEYR
ncbi:MAG: hypothetical protein ABI083_14495 [Lapillicoccus sp.]